MSFTDVPVDSRKERKDSTERSSTEVHPHYGELQGVLARNGRPRLRDAVEAFVRADIITLTQLRQHGRRNTSASRSIDTVFINFYYIDVHKAGNKRYQVFVKNGLYLSYHRYNNLHSPWFTCSLARCPRRVPRLLSRHQPPSRTPKPCARSCTAHCTFL